MELRRSGICGGGEVDARDVCAGCGQGYGGNAADASGSAGPAAVSLRRADGEDVGCFAVSFGSVLILQGVSSLGDWRINREVRWHFGRTGLT